MTLVIAACTVHSTRATKEEKGLPCSNVQFRQERHGYYVSELCVFVPFPNILTSLPFVEKETQA